MNDTPIKYFLPEGRPDLVRGTEGSSGYDLRSTDVPITLRPGQRWTVKTDLYLDMPLGVEAQVRSRSGIARNFGVVVPHAPGTIDADYRGELGVLLMNLGQEDFEIVPGERIAQLVFCPVFHVFRIPTNVREGQAQDPNELIYQQFFMAAGAIRNGLVRVSHRSELSETVRGPGGFGSTGRG